MVLARCFSAASAESLLRFAQKAALHGLQTEKGGIGWQKPAEMVIVRIQTIRKALQFRKPERKDGKMLELQNLVFEAPDAETDKESPPLRTIIDDISFTFEAGGFYAVTGPNGSGKTTIAKLIMGINEPSSGRILLDGDEISGMPIHERSKSGIVYGFQHPARFKGTTFRDLLAIAAGTEDEDALVQIIARVGICSLDFLDKPVDSKLSGGEIKKIELATVIARNPRLAIYDEPDTGIDLWTIGPMVDLLKREQQENNTTTIVVSHNKAFLEAADTLLLLRNGRIAYTGGLEGAKPILEDLSVCTYSDTCEGEANARCYR
jgi:Fe-S cluster assembly ATP-binding protein